MPLSPAQAFLAAGLPIGLAALFLFGLHAVLHRAGRPAPERIVVRVALAIAGWLAVTGTVAATGFLSDFDARPPRIAFVLAPVLIATVLLARSRRLGSLLPHVPITWPIGAQAFRVVVELMLWWFYAAGMVPRQMTFEGMNFDVVTGLLALPVAFGLARLGWPRAIGIAYNVLGLALLITIVTVALLSVPGPLRVFMNEPANALPATFPFVWLPTFLVPAALFLHLVSLRQLLGKSGDRVNRVIG
jgi:hypothetical protein